MQHRGKDNVRKRLYTNTRIVPKHTGGNHLYLKSLTFIEYLLYIPHIRLSTSIVHFYKPYFYSELLF